MTEQEYKNEATQLELLRERHLKYNELKDSIKYYKLIIEQLNNTSEIYGIVFESKIHRQI